MIKELKGFNAQSDIRKQNNPPNISLCINQIEKVSNVDRQNTIYEDDLTERGTRQSMFLVFLIILYV